MELKVLVGLSAGTEHAVSKYRCLWVGAKVSAPPAERQQQSGAPLSME